MVQLVARKLFDFPRFLRFFYICGHVPLHSQKDSVILLPEFTKIIIMKKQLLFILLALVPLVASAYHACIDGIYYNFSGNEATVTSGDIKYSSGLVIPESITYSSKTYSVTSIGFQAFFYCSGLTSVTIPNSVTYIGISAFSGCSGLTSVTIGNSVTSIGDGAFRDCSGLTSVAIPNSVTSIGYEAFFGCTNLTSISIPNSLTSIDWRVFSGCGLNSISVASGNTAYDSRNDCNAIIETASNTLIVGCQNSVIPNSVTSIGDWAFSYCSGLTSVTIPNSVTSIGGGAFANCI